MRLAFAALLLLAPLARAADPAPDAAPTAPAAAPAPVTPAEPVADRDRTPAESGEALGGRLTSLEEQFAETKGIVETLNKIRISGYGQARYTAVEGSVGGADAKGAPTVKDGFTIRRARLKTTYTGTWSQFVTEFDVSSRGVSLKVGEVHVIEPWTGKRLELVAGQMKWPFGFEAPQSSADRDLPELSRVVKAFLPGEYDRGVKLVANVGVLRAQAGLFDGNGVENKAFANIDNDRSKDVIGRVGVDLGWLTGGVSGWYGETLRAAVPESGSTPAVTAKFFPRTRVGADLQLFADLFPFGASSLKLELIRGRTFAKDGVEVFNAPAMGWYALLTQNIGLKNVVAARLDYFDPLMGKDDTADAKGKGQNAVGTLGLTVVHHVDEVVKLSATYEVVKTQGPAPFADPADNIFTLQLQARF